MQNSSRGKDLLKNSLVLSIGTLAPKLLSLLSIPILTACLSKEEFGRYDLIVSVILFVIPVITLQIEQGIFRFTVDNQDEAQQGRYISSAYCFVLLGIGGVCVIGAAVMAALGMELVLIALIAGVLFMEAVYMLTGQAVRGLRKAMIYSLGAVVYSTVYTLMLIWSVYLADMGVEGVLLASVGGYLAASAFMLMLSRLYRLLNLKDASKEALGQLLAFSAPIVPSSISLWIVNFIDRIIIVAVLGEAMNGVYSVATKVSQLYTTLYGIFTLAWAESAVRSMKDEDAAEYYSRMFSGVFRATTGVMLALFALTPLMYRLLINPQYDSAYVQTLVLYFGMFFNSLVSFYAGIYVALKRTKQVGYSSAAGALINIAVNLLLVHRFGLFAASVSTAVSFLAIVLYRGIDLQRQMRLRYDFREIAAGLAAMLAVFMLMLLRSVPATIAALAAAFLYNMKANGDIVRGLLGYAGKLMKKISGKSLQKYEE